MGPDHDHVAIGDTSIVEVPRQCVGSLVDLAVGEAALWSCGRPGLNDTGAVGVGLSLTAEVFLDRAHVARPVEVDGGIRELSHCCWMLGGRENRVHPAKAGSGEVKGLKRLDLVFLSCRFPG
jgi:hypothetical protein